MNSEIALLRHFAKTSDPEAFSEIVRRHAGLVYGACLRVLDDRDRAADATQETFLQLLRNAEAIADSVPSWLHRVATRKAINMIHEDSSRRRREAKYAAGKPLHTSRWDDISASVDEVLDELDEEVREILIRHFIEGRTMSDIAGDSGISQPTVSRRVKAGVAELREKLNKRGIIVGAAALGLLLTENAAQAAPAVVIKELGKIALVGGSAAASSLGSSAASSGAAAKAAVTGILTGVKAKVIAAAAVAAVGVGGVVTYNQVTRPAEQSGPPGPIAKPVAESRPKAAAPPVRAQQPARNERVATVVAPAGRTVRTDKPISDVSVASSGPVERGAEATSTKAPRSANGSGYGAHYWGRAATSAEEEPNDTENTETSSRRGISRHRR